MDFLARKYRAPAYGPSGRDFCKAVSVRLGAMRCLQRPQARRATPIRFVGGSPY